jgi:hypothetical protein
VPTLAAAFFRGTLLHHHRHPIITTTRATMKFADIAPPLGPWLPAPKSTASAEPVRLDRS